MTYTYDVETDIGRVRRTIPDRVQASAIWTDEEIQSFLNDEDGWRRAAALALETMASDNVLVMKVMTIQNIRTDGAAVSRALLERAKTLRSLADQADATSGDAFDIAETVLNDFGFRQQILNEAIRET